MTAALTREEVAFVSDWLRRRAAVVIDQDHSYVIETRLATLARTIGLESPSEIVVALRSQCPGDLDVHVIDTMTTHETLFFRDIHPFESLATDVLPALVAARPHGRPLRVWSGACSTGQEPYSIAMTVRERFPHLGPADVRIVGTDIARSVIERARAGVYKLNEVQRGLSAERLARHFEQVGREFHIARAVKDLVEVQELNLLERWPALDAFDVVFLRNVLVYFDEPTRSRILHRVRDVMREGGTLFLGTAEILKADVPGLERVTCGKTQVLVKRGC
ncbi:MAG: protein-glutamate O-methyltransferase CheR [Myxococcales bacterium]|nr:protein-glutamate O-methyltransferase CheR [Myxococcales bacterium]MCB9731132.1 protein-glutamate O-methyltransferase CheR [Deltaproteobacteria bacterium]